jgi:hypothetical protein
LAHLQVANKSFVIRPSLLRKDVSNQLQKCFITLTREH